MGIGANRAWSIGSLDLWVSCLPREWRIAHGEVPVTMDRLSSIGPSPEVAAPAGAEVLRFATDPSDERIRLRPLGADRPIIVRPAPALGLPPGDQATFYVGTPVWVEVSSGRGRRLLEVPVQRPSDTWFGATPREGELCYASRTKARLFLAELPAWTGRVITEVRVRNQGAEMLPIERVYIPMPGLDLYTTDARVLWTQSVTVVRESDKPLAEVRIDSKPPSAAGRTVLLSRARRPGVPSILVRALSALLP